MLYEKYRQEKHDLTVQGDLRRPQDANRSDTLQLNPFVRAAPTLDVDQEPKIIRCTLSTLSLSDASQVNTPCVDRVVMADFVYFGCGLHIVHHHPSRPITKVMLQRYPLCSVRFCNKWPQISLFMNIRMINRKPCRISGFSIDRIPGFSSKDSADRLTGVLRVYLQALRFCCCKMYLAIDATGDERLHF